MKEHNLSQIKIIIQVPQKDTPLNDRTMLCNRVYCYNNEVLKFSF